MYSKEFIKLLDDDRAYSPLLLKSSDGLGVSHIKRVVAQVLATHSENEVATRLYSA